ncbi:hypothetical protein FHR72_003640 [Mycolicibacterium iranicum]|uniref:Uncharacterized protein n=1 Tax=Mycolicibacterium iranicum TaxID=912594 RepID=A0A839QBE5_MYCIR|nr:hypothetical protein [Mycolicibacterium iranicum]MBB2992144.1 hypothetical protein [Mycolicibacterium iranicum]
MSELPAQTPLQDAGGTAATPEGGSAGEPQKGNKEARYRVERNEARAERDALAQRVERMQTRELERVAGVAISNPADLLALTGKSLAEFLDESGELDAELVAEAAAELLNSRPGLRRHASAFDPTQGTGGSGRPKREPSWGALLGD